GTALTYSVTGSSVDKYEMSVSGYTITYSYDPYTDITFVLDAGDGVTSGSSFDFSVTYNDGTTSSTSTSSYEAGSSTSISDVVVGGQLTFTLSSDLTDYYDITYDTSFPYTIEKDGVITATISRKAVTLTVVTVAGDSFSAQRSPSITVNASVASTTTTDSAAKVKLSGKGVQNTIITLSDYVGASYSVGIDKTSSDLNYYNVSLSGSSGTLEEDTTIVVTLTRKTATMNVSVIAGNDFAKGKVLSDAVSITVTDGSFDTSPSSSPYDVTLGETDAEVKVLSNNEQPIGATYKVTLDEDIEDYYDIEISSPDAASVSTSSVEGTVISGENNIVITLTRKTGVISVTVYNKVNSGTLSAITASDDIDITITGTEDDGDSISIEEESFTTPSTAGKSSLIYVPTGTYAITQTMPSITSGHTVDTAYTLNSNTVSALSGITVTTTSTALSPQAAVITNTYTIPDTTLVIKFKFADDLVVDDSIMEGIIINYVDSEGNDVDTSLAGCTASSTGTYTVLQTEISAGTISFSLELDTYLSQIMEWGSSTRYQFNMGSSESSVKGTIAEKTVPVGTEKLTITFTGELLFKTPTTYTDSYLYIGDSYKSLNLVSQPAAWGNGDGREDGEVYIKKSGNSDYNMYFWYYTGSGSTTSTSSSDYSCVTLQGFSYSAASTNRYYTYDISSLKYQQVNYNSGTVSYEGSAGAGQIWYYKGVYYVQISTATSGTFSESEFSTTSTIMKVLTVS
ncbi:MAG: hypothetical protein K6A23_08065, partial [Butyrivibrio sp.]|nr:hypothetical protein [Butyrivibrio sp.]